MMQGFGKRTLWMEKSANWLIGKTKANGKLLG